MIKKRTISIITTVVLIISSIYVAVPVTSASISGVTNKTTNVYMAPYNTSEHIVDSIAANKNVTVIDRELDFLYIYYTVGSVRKSGYVPLNNVNASGYTYHAYTHYESAINHTLSSQTVYYCPDGKDQYGSIDSNEGEIYNKPLTVLRQENGYSFVQYVTNPQNNGSANVIFKRGWVDSDVLTIEPKTSAVTSPSSATKYYIKNVATGLYLDVASYSIADGANIHIWEYHGGYNQEFILQPITTTHGSTYVRLLTNMASAHNKAVRVATGAAIMNSNVDLHTISNLRSQEFYFQPTLDGHYYIRSRCGQNYMMLGVDPSDSGVGGDVLLRYPSGSLYDKWDIEVAYEEGVDYLHKEATNKISSNISDGVIASYNIESVSKEFYTFGRTIDFEVLTNVALSAWTSENKKITTMADNSSDDTIVWMQEGGYIEYPNGDLGYLFGGSQIRTGNQAVISMYYDAVYNYCRNNSITNKFEQVWQSTLVHELGHSLGLDHVSRTDSLMSQNRDRTTVIVPQKMDISGVKKNYSPQK